MPIDRRRHIIFVHIPKTGGSSIERMFGMTTSEHFVSAGPLKDLTPCNKSPQHFTWIELKRVLPLDFVQRAYKFAFVRNPWARFLSEYRYRQRDFLFRVRKMRERYYDQCCFDERHLSSLDAFVDVLELTFERRVDVYSGFDAHLETQLSFISDEHNQIAMDYIGRLEEFEKDVRMIANMVGVHIDKILQVNRSDQQIDYRHHYSQYARDAVASFYRDDIAAFRYVF